MTTKKPKTLNDDGVRQLLREQCSKAGGQTHWASTASVSSAYVSDVLNNRRQPGDSILRALGYKKRPAEYVPDSWDAPNTDVWKDKE